MATCFDKQSEMRQYFFIKLTSSHWKQKPILMDALQIIVTDLITLIGPTFLKALEH